MKDFVLWVVRYESGETDFTIDEAQLRDWERVGGIRISLALNIDNCAWFTLRRCLEKVGALLDAEPAPKPDTKLDA